MRTTLSTPGTHAAAATRIPDRGNPDRAYASNVRVAELNALNPTLAVIAWKRSCGLYTSAAEHAVFVADTGTLRNEQMR